MKRAVRNASDTPGTAPNMTVQSAAGMMKNAKLNVFEKRSPYAMTPNCEKHRQNERMVSARNDRNLKRGFRSTEAPQNNPGRAGLAFFEASLIPDSFMCNCKSRRLP